MDNLELIEVPNEMEAVRITGLLQQNEIKCTSAPRQRDVSPSAFGFPAALGTWAVYIKPEDLLKAKEILNSQT